MMMRLGNSTASLSAGILSLIIYLLHTVCCNSIRLFFFSFLTPNITWIIIFLVASILGFIRRGGDSLLPNLLPTKVKFREAAVGIFARRRSLFTSLHAPLGWCNSEKICRCVLPERKISRSTSVFSTVSANMSLPSKVVEHIVFFNVKEGTPPEKVNAMVSALQGLKSLDTVLQFTAGPVLHVTSETYKFTHALHSRYKDKQGLADYSGHPQHLSVVNEFVLPIIDDIFAFDWEADLDGPMMPTYGALKVTVLNPKDLAQPQRFELIEILSGYKSIFPTIGQVSFGENFSPARAKGFTWGFLSLFPGIKELDELNKNAEHIQLQGEKILPQVEKFMVVDMIASPNPASL